MEHTPLKRYIIRYLLITFGLFIVMGLVPGLASLPAIINVFVAGGVAFYVGRLFAKEHNRQPVIPEQNRFSLIAFGVQLAVGVSLMALQFALLPEEWASFQAKVDSSPLSAIIVGIGIGFLMFWGFVHTGFRMGAAMYMKKLSKGNI